ncbi:ATP-binding protein [Pseudoduganella chitinolytica]|uniref:histidine kinase n=1 Tax=Pseudoduganella chitinolytica TaxID=34070 RepID=A0ABY8BC21_9BURK|nr:ATP-binding protein [Pseudoduganella chitinolytica]WEF32718.1 ATP-binding protein [Pseudoduganella chitinolytica]
MMRWPRTLFGRLVAILLCGLVAAQALTFGAVWYERMRASQTMMYAYMGRDVASSVAMLERLPAAERGAWLDTLDRRNYRYRLGVAVAGRAAAPPDDAAAASVAQWLGPRYRVDIAAMPPDSPRRLVIDLRDGTPLAIDFAPAGMPFAQWLPLLLAAQLAVLALSCWLAVRIAARPLARLAQAAEALSPTQAATPVPEEGPAEVAQAARSFNAMQARIARHLQERTRMLAAIAHDLQTPVTRMRLRTELMDDDAERNKWQADLAAMQALIREGIAYARSAHAAAEPAVRCDVDALLAAIAADYADAGQAVTLRGTIGATLVSRPQALRRIATNLVDNALKFAGAAEIEAGMAAGRVTIAVLDRGPGIPADQLDAVLQPFYRLEGSRNAATGGSGLGLAIAQELAEGMGAALALSARAGGGLRAQVTLPPAQGRAAAEQH